MRTFPTFRRLQGPSRRRSSHASSGLCLPPYSRKAHFRRILYRLPDTANRVLFFPHPALRESALHAPEEILLLISRRDLGCLWESAPLPSSLDILNMTDMLVE